MTIAEFLRERINEDEAEIGPLFGRDEKAGPNGIGWAEVGAIGEVLMCGQARALAECEAKRLAVAACVNYLEGHDGGLAGDVGCEAWDVLCALALPYADHAHYREEWRP